MQGATLGIYVGPAVPAALEPELVELVDQVSVTSQDTGRSGFQVSFVAGRDRDTGRAGYPPLLEQKLKVGNRMQITGSLGARTHVLMDGIITNHQLTPGAEPGGGRFTVTGEDISVMLDLVEVKLPFPAMSDYVIAGLILAGFSAFGVVPIVIPEPAIVPPLPTEEIPQRNGTFLGILNEMAGKWKYVFYVDPGPTRGLNTAYWGPPIRAGVPQKALTWRMGSDSNLGSIQFQHDGTKPRFVYGLIQEKNTNAPVPIASLPFTGVPLAALPSYVGNLPFVGAKRLADDSGGNAVKALWDATGEFFQSAKASVTASGELDVSAYGEVLQARSLVDVRGVGQTMDGSWYVQSVTHTISRASWKQSFNLEREGTMPLMQKAFQV